ncbi:hypothetical protein C8R44DRAFT_744067 [Mycena epipterygia]|nr:hypothetical protein C8R44DRAFT_744067 [Mycena epipterygia]
MRDHPIRRPYAYASPHEKTPFLWMRFSAATLQRPYRIAPAFLTTAASAIPGLVLIAQSASRGRRVLYRSEPTMQYSSSEMLRFQEKEFVSIDATSTPITRSVWYHSIFVADTLNIRSPLVYSQPHVGPYLQLQSAAPSSPYSLYLSTFKSVHSNSLVTTPFQPSNFCIYGSVLVGNLIRAPATTDAVNTLECERGSSNARA